jgi:hypothetical protein
MTEDECFDANGRFDISSLEHRCTEGATERCCVEDVMTDPCPFECVYGAAKCQNRGGIVHGWQSSYECSEYYDVCCEDAEPLDSDTAIFMGEAFDPATCPTEHIVTPKEQPDKVASGICMELFDETGPWFCPQADYERIVRDIAIIKAAHPVLEQASIGQIFDAFQEGIIPFTIMCVPGASIRNCTDFQRGEWQDLLDCFGGDHEHCLFTGQGDDTCGQSHLWFEVGVNTKRMQAYFEDHGKSMVPGTVCELNSYAGASYPYDGFHPKIYGFGFWVWEARATAQYEMFDPHCDIRIAVATEPDGTLTTLDVDNQSDPFCTNPAF